MLQKFNLSRKGDYWVFLSFFLNEMQSTVIPDTLAFGLRGAVPPMAQCS